MKKNYNLNQENGIKKITLLSSTIIILFVATITGYNLIKTEYDNFKKHINSFKETLIEREKFYVKSSVENLKNDIDFEELSIINNKKHHIKNQSIVAYNLASSIYKQTTKLSKNEQINLIKIAIKQIAQKSNNINYFILDTKGNLILNSENQSDENKNFYNFEDMNGRKFVREMIQNNSNKQNFIDYFWYIPNQSLSAKKITYSRHLKELGLIIGSGTFLEKQNSELISKLITKIENQNVNNEEFIFIYKINSLNNIINESELITKKLIEPKKEDIEAMEKLLINTNYTGKDYIFYENNQKLLYGIYLKNYRFFISTGVNLSNIYDIVEKEKIISLDNMYKNIIRLVFIMIIMTIIFFIFSILFTKKIEKIFKEYKQNLILKENQEKMLIQKSKMASMGEMIGNIAHQWRQPLSQLSGLFFDIESAYDYKELNKKYLTNRVEEANDLLEYMSKTIDDFKNFFNPNSQKENFFINQAVQNALKIVQSTLDFHQIKISVQIDETFKKSGYQNEYSQAIMNIISNAKDILIEKNISNPQIRIYLEKNILCIEDNAGGINEEIINKIFDPYFTTKYEYGTGIGLYMTKMIIEEKMGGYISVKNTKIGAKFFIEI